FWGRIGIRASTSSHFLRICFLITRIISNAYFVIRPVCAKFGLNGMALPDAQIEAIEQAMLAALLDTLPGIKSF
ncbi:MAG: hypothetical protein Q8O37_04630, partial [Sulfuricellaceae bacterium]|nr:hypothetical protein [Sulfuricellaceae bacterium]